MTNAAFVRAAAEKQGSELITQLRKDADNALLLLRSQDTLRCCEHRRPWHGSALASFPVAVQFFVCLPIQFTLRVPVGT